MTHWSHVVREIYCHKGDEKWPKHCKDHDTSSHCHDIHGDTNPGIVCKHSSWCDVKEDFVYVHGNLILKRDEDPPVTIAKEDLDIENDFVLVHGNLILKEELGVDESENK